MAKRRKTDEEIRKTRNARMHRYYINKLQKSMPSEEINDKNSIDSLRNELKDLFFRADMDDIDVNKIESVREVKLSKDYNIQVFKLGNNYLWRYKNIISDLLPSDKILKDAKRALI